MPESGHQGIIGDMSILSPVARNGTAKEILDHFGQPYRRPQVFMPTGEAQPGAMALPSGWGFIARQFGSNFSLWQAVWDEALRHSRSDAVDMLHDGWIKGMLRERIRATCSLPWHLETPDDHDAQQRRVKEGITRLIKSMPFFRRMSHYLLWALWFGKHGVQCDWNWTAFQDGMEGDLHPARGLRPRQIWQVQGDKIGHQEDGTPFIYINPTMTDKVPGAKFIPGTTVGSAGLILRGKHPAGGLWRERFIIHHNMGEDRDYFSPDEVEAQYGVGLRNDIFWLNWLRMEWLSNITDFFSRVGLGITLWKYPRGNDSALQQIKQVALQESNKAHIFVPTDPDGSKGAGTEVERVEIPVSGAEALKVLIEHLEQQIERCMLCKESGASFNSEKGTAIGQEMQKDTRGQMIAEDALLLAETYTGSEYEPGLVSVIQKYTYAWSYGPKGFPVWFKYDIERSESEKKLASARTLVEMGVPVKMDEVRSAAGFSRPIKGDEVIKPQQKSFGPGEQEPEEEGAPPDEEAVAPEEEQQANIASAIEQNKPAVAKEGSFLDHLKKGVQAA